MPNLITLQSILRGLKVVIDFLIIWILIYYLLKIVRNNSRTVQIFKGIVLVLAMQVFANAIGLPTLRSLLGFVIQYGVLVVVIIFQPEIRAVLERIGKTSVFSALHSLTVNEKEALIDELVEASVQLSQEKTGALISLEQGHSLVDYIKTGTPINSTVTADLLTSIFVTSTPLHDGAVIIQGDRIACASAYFPPTSLDLPTKFGARHRAALGISEVSDSITIVVSEETGKISIAEEGKLHEVDETALRDYLNLLIQNTEQELSRSVDAPKRRRFNLERLNIDPIKVEKLEDQQEEEKERFTGLKSFFSSKKEPEDKKQVRKERSDENEREEDKKD